MAALANLCVIFLKPDLVANAQSDGGIDYSNSGRGTQQRFDARIGWIYRQKPLTTGGASR